MKCSCVGIHSCFALEGDEVGGPPVLAVILCNSAEDAEKRLASLKGVLPNSYIDGTSVCIVDELTEESADAFLSAMEGGTDDEADDPLSGSL